MRENKQVNLPRPRQSISIRSLVISIVVTAVITSSVWFPMVLWKTGDSSPNGPTIGLRADFPEHVKVGQPFDLTVVLENRQKDEVFLKAVHLDNTLVKDATILSISPVPCGAFDGDSYRSFKFAYYLERGTNKIAFHLKVNTKRRFQGEIVAMDLDKRLGDTNIDFQSDPGDASSYNEIGNEKLRKGDIDGAIGDYTQAVELSPQDAAFYTNRATAKIQKYDFDSAITDCNRALDINPKYGRAYVERCYSKRAKGDYDGSFADCNRALELDPEDARAFDYRGRTKLGTGDYDGSIADCNRALELDPQYAPDSWFVRAMAKYGAHDLDSALRDLKRSLQVASGRQRSYPNFWRWVLQSKLGRRDAADKELQESVVGNAIKGDFESKVAEFLVGKIKESDFFAAATTGDLNMQRYQQCAAWYFAGVKQLLAGNMPAAKDNFRKCRATDIKGYLISTMAGIELKWLGE